MITVNITDDFDFDNPQFENLLESCDSWGGIYLENFRTKPFAQDSKYKQLNKYIQARDPNMQKSFCCRFQVSIEDIKQMKLEKANNVEDYENQIKQNLRNKISNGSGSIFRSNSGVGGVGVFNINLNRIGYVCQGNWEMYYSILERLIRICSDAASRKRAFIDSNRELYPIFFFYNENLDSYYNVISVCGGHESLVNMGVNSGIISDEGISKAAEVATFIRELLTELTEQKLELHSLEYAPAESASPKLAKLDIKFSEWLEQEVNHYHSDSFKCFYPEIIDQIRSGAYYSS